MLRHKKGVRAVCVLKNQKELAKQVCDRINEHGHLEQVEGGSKLPYSIDRGFGSQICYMPEENLKLMLETEIKDWDNMSDVFEAWGHAGAYRFVVAKGDLAYCALRKKSIQIQTFKGTWTLTFHDSMEEDPYMNCSCYNAFLVMLMYIADIRVSQTAAYPLRYRGDFQHVKFLDVPDARVIRNASDISNCLLDEI